VARAKPTQITQELNDIWRLVVGYAKQETAAPLRGVLTFVRFGLLGMICFALGGAFAALATLRGLQTETVLDGNGWQSAVAYFITVVVCAVVLGLAVRSVARTPWKNKEGDNS
jgi:Na+/H+ antiporter NhaC